MLPSPVSGGDAVIVLLSAVVVLLVVRLNVSIPPVALPGAPPAERDWPRGDPQRAEADVLRWELFPIVFFFLLPT